VEKKGEGHILKTGRKKTQTGVRRAEKHRRTKKPTEE
jgi:hypothetical protein